MTASRLLHRLLRATACAAGIVMGVSVLTGCQWVQTRYESMRGDGFKDHQTGASLRGDNSDAKPSGFFTDKRSDQIEQNLGGF